MPVIYLIRKFFEFSFVQNVLNSSTISESRTGPLGIVAWNFIPTAIRNSFLMRINSPIIQRLSSCDARLMSSRNDDHYLALIKDRCKTWERDTQAFWSYKSKSAHSIVDVGAYIGIYSLIAAKANPSARVVAIEPNPVTFDGLIQNVNLNSLESIATYNIALGAFESFLDLSVPKSRPMSSGANLIGEGVSGEMLTFQVEQKRLDDLVESVDLMKIDAEGWELEVLKGSERLLAQCHPTIICEILTSSQFESVRNFMSNFNYSVASLPGYKNSQEHLAVTNWKGKANYVFY